jgi:prevent-host-death family protein
MGDEQGRLAVDYAIVWLMRIITQRELRNHSGEILRQAEAGQQFTVTVDGQPVAVLGPYPKRQWVPKAEVLKILRSQPPDPTFSEDLAELGGTLEDLEDPWEKS